MMTRLTYVSLMNIIVKQFQAVNRVEETGVISLYGGEWTENFDKTCDIIMRDIGDDAGFTSFALEHWMNFNDQLEIKDTVINDPDWRFFRDWGELYDFITSDFVRQYKKEYEKMLWG